MNRRWIPALVGSVVVIAGFVALRRGLGLEFEPESIGAAVDRLGVYAPLGFVAIVIFRVPLGLPSQLVLVGGGALFGALEGTLYGAAGLVLSALICFLGARWAGREAVEKRLPRRFRGLLEVASSRAGALFIGVGTAYPVGPITSYYLLAGVTSMALLSFVVAVAAGSLVRAALYTSFGSALMEGNSALLLGSAALAALVVVAPLCFSRSRAWLLEALGRSEPPPAAG